MGNKNRQGKGFGRVYLVVALIAFFSSALAAPALEAREREGAQVIVTKTDLSIVQGELLAVRDGNLILMDESTLTGVTIDVADIRNVKVRKKGRFLKGFGIGMATGAVLGLIINRSSDSGSGSSYRYWDDPGIDFSPNIILPDGLVALTFGLFGGLVGGVAGGISKRTIEFNGKTPLEMSVNIAKLRKLAREQN